MRLTTYSDYSLRVLLYLSLHGDNLSTIKDIAQSYNISKNHLMKVVHNLVTAGYIESIRGRSGGLRLAREPKDIILGEVVRKTEDDFKIVECFDPKTNTCRIAEDCKLKHMLNEALFAFLNVLDKYTLQDLSSPRTSLKSTLGFDN